MFIEYLIIINKILFQKTNLQAISDAVFSDDTIMLFIWQVPFEADLTRLYIRWMEFVHSTRIRFARSETGTKRIRHPQIG